MNFDKLYERPAGLAKMLEVRWFHFHAISNKSDYAMDDESHTPLQHRMPFLHRSLSYIQAAKVSASTGMHTIKRSRKNRQASSANADAAREDENDSKRRKVDLLFKLFKHRVRNYNEAFLSSPRRATRASYAKDVATAIAKSEEDSGQSDDGNRKRAMDTKDEKEQQGEAEGVTSPKGGGDCDTRSPKKRRRSDGGLRVSPMPSLPDESPMVPSRAVSVLQHKRSPAGTVDSTDNVVTFATVPQTRMFLHYLYLESDNVPAVQVESREDRMCPFCFIDACSDYGLFMHCKVTHGDGFSFDAARSEDGTLHVSICKDTTGPPDVKDDHLRDFVFVRSTTDVQDTYIPFVKRPRHKAATLDLATRKKKVRLLQENGADSSVARRFIPGDDHPLRQYFHSRTNLPMLEGEWDADSDDEPDETWLHKMSEQLLDEFEDVSANEKIFMKIWNRFIKSHTITADNSLPSSCMRFIENYTCVLRENDLRQNLLLHCMNLWDEGLLSSKHVMDCMVEYDSLVEQVPKESML